MTGLCPASFSRLTVCDPIYPAPPATRTFMRILLFACDGREYRGRGGDGAGGKAGLGTRHFSFTLFGFDRLSPVHSIADLMSFARPGPSPSPWKRTTMRRGLSPMAQGPTPVT